MHVIWRGAMPPGDPKRMMPLLTSVAAAALATVVAFGAALAQDIDGEAAFNNACRTCHTTRPGDNRLGPHLAGVIGRKAGAVEDYSYSAAMKGAGLTWDEATLDKFIANPDAVVQGNNMKPYTGIQDAAQRKAIIMFLKTK
jgi:cytochrome c